MNNDVSMKSNPASSDLTSTSKTLVRMNGVMPDISTLGNSEKSERASRGKESQYHRKYFMLCARQLWHDIIE